MTVQKLSKKYMKNQLNKEHQDLVNFLSQPSTLLRTQKGQNMIPHSIFYASPNTIIKTIK